MDYKVIIGDYSTEEKIAHLRELFDASYGVDKAVKLSSEFIKWQYLDNPNGHVVSFNAWSEEDEMAGHYATIPVKMMLDGKEVKGLLSLNTATHPKHQGKGLFTKLAAATYEYAKENGYKYVIGVANANSTHGFLKKLGFYLVAPLDVKVGVGNPFKNVDFTSKNYCYYDQKTLDWRLSNPTFVYTEKGNTIWGSRNEPCFKTCVAPVPDGIISTGLKKGGSLFGLYVGLGIKPSGLYVHLPKFIKRSPFNLIFRDLTDGELPKITPENIVFTLMDYDVA